MHTCEIVKYKANRFIPDRALSSNFVDDSEVVFLVVDKDDLMLDL